MNGIERGMQRYLAIVAGRQEKDAAFGDVLIDCLAAHLERHIDRTAAMQHHETIRDGLEPSFEGPFALHRRKRAGPSEAFTRSADIGLEPLKDTMGFVDAENGSGFHRKPGQSTREAFAV